MNILITSVGTATSIGLIKNFKQSGNVIIGVDINPFGYTAGSQMVDYYQQVPYADDAEYITVIKEIVSTRKVDILIPVNDIEIYVLSKHKEEIGCSCIIPDISVIDLCRDKYICSRKIEELGVNVSEILDKDDITIKRILRDRIGVGSKGIKILEAGEISPDYVADKKFLQRFVEGEEYTVDILADKNGNPVYIVPRKRLEVKSGVATKVKVEKQDELITTVKKILKNFTLPGFSNMQFIKDKNNVFWFIEINYRFSGCGAATIAVSPEFINSFLKLFNGTEYIGEINADVKWNSVVTRYYEEIVYEESIS